MTSALRALTAEPWAIRPDYLHFMASLASLDRDARAGRRSAEGEDWFRLDLQAAAGPTAQRMDGARHAMLTREGVAIIPLVGPIFPRANMMTEMSGSGTSAAMLARDLQLARDSADVGAVLLMVDPPGGSPTGINALADQIYAMRGRKRVLAHVTGTCASAASRRYRSRLSRTPRARCPSRSSLRARRTSVPIRRPKRVRPRSGRCSTASRTNSSRTWPEAARLRPRAFGPTSAAAASRSARLPWPPAWPTGSRPMSAACAS